MNLSSCQKQVDGRKITPNTPVQKLGSTSLATPKNLPQIGNCPVNRLSELEKKAWFELVANAPKGVITNADSHTIEITAVLLAAFRESGAEMKSAQLSLLIRLLGSIGCVPSERHKVEFAKPTRAAITDF